MLLLSVLSLQVKKDPNLCYEWLVSSIDGVEVKSNYEKPFFFLALAPNGVFKSMHNVKMPKHQWMEYESYGHYSIGGDQIVLRYEQQIKTPYHEVFGPGMTFKTKPPQDLTFTISQAKNHELVLSNSSAVYVLRGDHPVTVYEPWWMSARERAALKKKRSS